MFYRPLRDEASVRKESETERMVWQICIIFIAMKAAIFQTMVIRSWYLEESGARKKRQMKWVKVSAAKLEAYADLVNYFFDDDDLHFRALVVDNKDKINHEAFDQTHDDWYYKMYFDMIKTILTPGSGYYIYLDIKDTKSKTKIRKLQAVLENSRYTFSSNTIRNIQVIRSHEVEIMQLTDILIGAAAYKLRGFSQSNAKNGLINLMERRSRYKFEQNALYRENKFNIFHLRLQEDV